jgi:hypothetical protein
MSLILLICTIATCLLGKFRPWKVSALELMFRGIALEDGERCLISDCEMEVKAKSIQFRLVQSKEGLSLKRMQDRPRHKGSRVEAVSQLHIALREHAQQEPTELYLMKLAYEHRRFTKISTKLLFKQKFLVKDGCVEGPALRRDSLSGFPGQLLDRHLPAGSSLDDPRSNRRGHNWQRDCPCRT